MLASSSVLRCTRLLGWKVVRQHTLQDVEADTAQLVDVGVEDLGQEANLGGDHGVVVGEEELELEVTT